MKTKARERWIAPVYIGIVIMLCLATCAREGFGQTTLYYSFQPADLGDGIRVDYYPFKASNLGLYNSLSYGNWGLYKGNGLEHHVKITTGVLIQLTEDDPYHSIFTLGINYHVLSKSILYNDLLNPVIFNPWSFELGYTTKFERFCIGVRTDIPRWEPCIDIGFFF